MNQYKEHETVLVADVDCTAQGKSLCTKAGVKGYPTIKYGDPSNLQDYSGSRDWSTLEKFAYRLKPVCGPASLNNCDSEQKKNVEKAMKLDTDAIKKSIKELENNLEELEAKHKKELEKLVKEQEKAEEEMLKSSGLDIYKAIIVQRNRVAEIAAGSPDARRKKLHKKNEL